jgi:hypothetical protein
VGQEKEEKKTLILIGVGVMFFFFMINSSFCFSVFDEFILVCFGFSLFGFCLCFSNLLK